MKAKTLLWIGLPWLALTCALVMFTHHHILYPHPGAPVWILPVHFFLLFGWIWPLSVGLYRVKQQR